MMHKEGSSQGNRNMRYKNYWPRCILLKVAWLKAILHFHALKGSELIVMSKVQFQN